MRDLLVTTHTPALDSGRGLRTYGIARALCAHRPLDLLYVRFGAAEPDASFRSIQGLQLHQVQASRGLARLGGYLAARLRGVPSSLSRGVSPELCAAAARLALEPDRGRVIADGPTIAAALMRLARERPVIYNAHNLESAFRHELEGGRRSARALRRFERRVLCTFAESWMVSEADIAGARDLCQSARLRYVPNVLDTDAIAPVDPVPGDRRAIFVASFKYEPNLIALRFLLDQVMPRVWREMPDARLAVVGAGLKGPVSSDERVETLGFVEDLHAIYETGACAVVPLLQGGGTPLKLIEALAYGLPVVATARAAGGLQLRDREHCLIAEGAEQFAESILAVFRGGDEALGRRGRQLAEQRFSISALAELLAT